MSETPPSAAPAPPRPPAPPKRRRWTRGIVLIVLLLALIEGVPMGLAWWRATHPGKPAAQETPPVPPGALVLTGEDARFSWPRDPRASVYRIEAYSEEHRLVAAAVLRDTAIPARTLLPDTTKSGTWVLIVVTSSGNEIRPSRPGTFVRR